MATTVHRMTPAWGAPLSGLGATALGVWAPNGGGGSVTVPALARIPFPATLQGTAIRGTGSYGRCITFDGTTGCYLSAAVPNATGQGTYSPSQGTIVFWLRTTQATSNTWLVGRCGNSSGDGILVLLNNTAGAVTVDVTNSGGGSEALITGPATANNGSWHMVAVTFRKGNGFAQTLYYDGLQAATATSGSGNWNISGANAIRWAISQDTFWGKFNGDMDPGAWFDRWLTAQEIETLWATGPGGFYARANPLSSLFTGATSPVGGPVPAALLPAM